MSVDNTSNSSSNQYHSETSGGTQGASTANLETLKSAFAQAMRISLTGASGNSTKETLLETVDESLRSAEQRRDDRNDSRLSQERTDNRNLFTTDRKALDRSEVRHDQMKNEYLDRVERREPDRATVRQPIEASKHEFVRDVSATPEPRISNPVAVVADRAVPNPAFVPQGAPTINMSLQSSVHHGNPGAGTTPLLSSDVSILSNVPAAIDLAAAIPTPQTVSMPLAGTISPGLMAAASVLTVFSASGKLDSDEDEAEEKDEAPDKKKDKKNRLVPLFGASVVEAARTDPPSHKIAQKIPSRDEQRQERDDEAERHAEQNEEQNRGAVRQDTPPEPPTVSDRSGVSEADLPEPFDQIRFLQRVAAACLSAANQNGTVRIKLHLDHLGTLTVRVTSGNGKIAVRFEASTKAAAGLLRDSVGELKSMLVEHGLTLDRVEIVA